MSFFAYFDRKFASVSRRIKSIRAKFSPYNPVTVFHHIPKCGGTSINQILDDWFVTVRDYRMRNAKQEQPRVDLSLLRSGHCLCGHFEMDGLYLHQRYPEVQNSKRFRIFTFIRDPLQIRLSLYRFEKERGILADHQTAKDALLNRTNYIASTIPATKENFREILDRYFYIGLLEEGQLSLDILAWLLGKKAHPFPRINETLKSDAFASESLTVKEIEQFREANKLDYMIYDYCKKRFNQMVFAYRNANKVEP